MFRSLIRRPKKRQPQSESEQERLRSIEIQTSRRILAHRLGEYESHQKGIGFEFMEHRRYQPGDDYRRIDWNVTSRFQYPFVKRFVADKEVQVWLVVDLSSSMSFGSGVRNKAQLVREVVATLGFSASQLHMKVGYLGFSDRLEVLLPPRQSRLVIWDILSRIPRSRSPRKNTRLEAALKGLSGRLGATSMIFLISDFISLEGAAGGSAMRYLSRHHDLIPLVIEDPLERAIPPISGMHCTEDPESGKRYMAYWSRKRIRRYQEQMFDRKDRLTGLFWGMGLDFLWIEADDSDYVDRLLEFFIRRRRAS